MVPDTLPTINRLGVIGDAHAEDERLARALAVLADESLDAVVCTGDIVDGTGCPDGVVRQLRQAQVLTVQGNHDRWLLGNKARHVPDAHEADSLDEVTLHYLTSLPTTRELQTAKGPLLLCHGVGDDDLRKVWPGSERMPPERSRRLDRMIHQGQYRFVINGHMHFRVLVHFQQMTLMNAGTLRGEHNPGFSVIDFVDESITPFTLVEQGVERRPTVPLGAQPDRRVWRNTQEFDSNWQPTRLF